MDSRTVPTDTAGVTLPGSAGEFSSIVSCFYYGYLEAQGNPIAEAEAGAKGVCDGIFLGARTWFTEIDPALAEAEGMFPLVKTILRAWHALSVVPASRQRLASLRRSLLWLCVRCAMREERGMESWRDRGM
jgi:hypothetical protein